MALTINVVNGTGYPPGAPAGVAACVSQVFTDVASWITVTGSVSLDVQLTWTDLGGSVIGSNAPMYVSPNTNYATTKTALQGFVDDATNNSKSTAYATLPGSDPS